MTHDPKARIQRQRERRAVKTADKAICRTYNHSGMDGVNDMVDAIGGGCVEHWTDSERGQGDE